MSAKTGSILTITVVAIVALLVWEDLILGSIFNALQSNAFWLLPLSLLVGGAVIAYASDRSSMPLRLLLTSVVFILVALIWGSFSVARHSYDTHRFYLQHVKEVSGATPSFDERAAFRVVKAQAPDNLGDVRGLIDETTYVAASDTFTSLVVKNGTFQGYASVLTQESDLTGQTRAKNCFFSDAAKLRLNGYRPNSLERAIAHHKFRAIVTDEDAFGYCDADTPMVVVPLTRVQGWFPAVRVPAGVAVYNGITGELSVRDSADDIPGPVFPISLAREMRESTAAMGGYWDYVKNRVGYTDTSHDVGDPNAGNAAEFALREEDGGAAVYATPLTARGRSTSIVALGVVEAGALRSKEFPTYTIYKLAEPRKSNSSVVDRLKLDYGNLPSWAAGMEIFEITPVTTSEWVASLGREKNVAYRVRIKPNGDSCLETASGEKLGCGQGAASVPEMESEEGEEVPEVTLPSDPSGLKNLSDEELSTLIRQLNDEILDRLNK